MSDERQPAATNLAELAAQLEQMLRLRAFPIGMKLFTTVDEMVAITKVRRPQAIHTLDQIVAQAARLGWTVGITADDLVGAQCRAVVGLGPKDDAWRSGRPMAGVWFATLEDAGKHQSAMNTVPHGRFRALAVSPLSAGTSPCSVAKAPTADSMLPQFGPVSTTRSRTLTWANR